MTVHEFRLHKEPFDTIASGKKTIEARLFDDKRQLIEVGDELVFTSRENPRMQVRARVTNLLKAQSFQELFASAEPQKFGKDSSDELLKQIEEFYTPEDQQKYGVVGIEFVRIVFGETPHLYVADRTDYLFRVSLKAVIFNDEGHVLVVKEHDRDWWDIPGGGMDHGETIRNALARELYEEVALTGEFEYETILAEDPRYNTTHNLYQMRLTFLVKPTVMQFEVGDDSDEILFIDPLTFKDSELITERKIYEYCEIAKKRLN